MPIIAKDSGKTFTPAPGGLHKAVCCDVVDLGLVHHPEWGDRHQVKLCWETEDLNPENGKPYLVIKRYTNSLHEKANLRKDLESWRGRAFTQEELKGFDLEKLIGANCQLNIVHNQGRDGNTYANISSIVPLGRGMDKMPISESYVRLQDRDNREPPSGGGGAPDPNWHPADDDIPFAVPFDASPYRRFRA